MKLGLLYNFQTKEYHSNVSHCYYTSFWHNTIAYILYLMEKPGIIDWTLYNCNQWFQWSLYEQVQTQGLFQIFSISPKTIETSVKIWKYSIFNKMVFDTDFSKNFVLLISSSLSIPTPQSAHWDWRFEWSLRILHIFCRLFIS